MLDLRGCWIERGTHTHTGTERGTEKKRDAHSCAHKHAGSRVQSATEQLLTAWSKLKPDVFDAGTHTCTCVYGCVFMYACMYVCRYVCMYVCVLVLSCIIIIVMHCICIYTRYSCMYS